MKPCIRCGIDIPEKPSNRVRCNTCQKEIEKTRIAISKVFLRDKMSERTLFIRQWLSKQEAEYWITEIYGNFDREEPTGEQRGSAIHRLTTIPAEQWEDDVYSFFDICESGEWLIPRSAFSEFGHNKNHRFRSAKKVDRIRPDIGLGV